MNDELVPSSHTPIEGYAVQPPFEPIPPMELNIPEPNIGMIACLIFIWWLALKKK